MIEATTRQNNSVANAILKPVPDKPIEEMAHSRHSIDIVTSDKTIAVLKAFS